LKGPKSAFDYFFCQLVLRVFSHQTRSSLEDELAAQQGLYIDIKPISILEAKMALHVLLRRSRHALAKLPGNLAVWNAATMSTRWAKVKRRADCAVCNPEGWIASREAKLQSQQGKSHEGD
jgi:hypothetical protein